MAPWLGRFQCGVAGFAAECGVWQKMQIWVSVAAFIPCPLADKLCLEFLRLAACSVVVITTLINNSHAPVFGYGSDLEIILDLTFFTLIIINYPFKNLNATVVGIGHPDSVMRIDGDSPGEPKAPGSCTVLSPVHQKAALRIKYLYILKKSVYHIEITIAVSGYALRAAETSGRIADGTDALQQAPSCIDLLYSEVHGICNI